MLASLWLSDSDGVVVLTDKPAAARQSVGRSLGALALANTTKLINPIVSLQGRMSKRTALNEEYRGLVEDFSIPAELHERGGRRYASADGVVPVHCCSPEEVAERAATTHHYCGVFAARLLAPLAELAYVRLDQHTAEKVFINRNKRILLVSSDGRLAQWRAAPTFESANRYMAGTPIVGHDGALVSVVTARRGNHYVVSTFEGEGGYFETSKPWETVDVPDGFSCYGDRSFRCREELLAHLASLPPALVSPQAAPRPLLLRARSPRIALVAENGRQISHQYLAGVLVTDVEYL